MNRIPFWVLHLFITTNAIAQDATVQFYKQNVMYVGVYNPITVAVRNTPCKRVLIVVPGCVVIPGNGLCHFNVMPAKPGTTTVKIYRESKHGFELVTQLDVAVKDLPEPVAKVAAINHGVIRKNVLVSQLGVVAYSSVLDRDTKFVVSSYSLIVVRNMLTIYGKAIKEARFDDEIKEQFIKLKEGDYVFIYDIIAKGPDNIEKHVESISLKIIE